jgi:hypothetical protein
MNITKQDRLELNALSKEVFGASSRWQTLLRKGNTVVTSKTPIGRRGRFDTRSKIKYETVEYLKSYMTELKVQKEAKLAEMKASIDAQNSKA